MNLPTLRKKALSNDLDVEHILKAAAAKQSGLAHELNHLSTECAWSSGELLLDGTREIPFAKWAEVAAAYSDGEFDALSKFAENPENTPFVLGLLEEINSLDALNFLLQEYAHLIDDPLHSVENSFRVASTLNLMLSFSPCLTCSAAQAGAIQKFLFTLFPLSNMEHHRATVILALRGVGDEKAIGFVLAVPELQTPWESVKQVTIRSIKKRLQKMLKSVGVDRPL